MMASIKAYAVAFIAALAAFAGVVLYGKGRKDAKAKHTEDNLKAANAAKENRYELENSDDQRLIDILSGKLRDR